MPSVTPEVTNRISPYSSLAAVAYASCQAWPVSSVKRIRAGLCSAKIGSICSSLKFIRMGIEEALAQETTPALVFSPVY